MPHRDLHNNIRVVQLLDPVAVTSTAIGTPAAGLDTRGFDAAELVALIGESGDTLSGSVFIEVIVEESDDDTTYTAVTNTDEVLIGSDSVAAAPDSSGVIATIDAAAEDDVKIRCGYIGDARYCQLVLTLTGTHTNGTPCGMIGILGFGSVPSNS